MPHLVSNAELTDSGLLCLVLLARYFQLPADAGQLKHEFGRSDEVFTAVELLRAAKHLGLKAREIHASRERLSNTPLPANVRYRDGRFVNQSPGRHPVRATVPSPAVFARQLLPGQARRRHRRGMNIIRHGNVSGGRSQDRAIPEALTASSLT